MSIKVAMGDGVSIVFTPPVPPSRLVTAASLGSVKIILPHFGATWSLDAQQLAGQIDISPVEGDQARLLSGAFHLLGQDVPEWAKIFVGQRQSGARLTLGSKLLLLAALPEKPELILFRFASFSRGQASPIAGWIAGGESVDGLWEALKTAPMVANVEGLRFLGDEAPELRVLMGPNPRTYWSGRMELSLGKRLDNARWLARSLWSDLDSTLHLSDDPLGPEGRIPDQEPLLVEVQHTGATSVLSPGQYGLTGVSHPKLVPAATSAPYVWWRTLIEEPNPGNVGKLANQSAWVRLARATPLETIVSPMPRFEVSAERMHWRLRFPDPDSPGGPGRARLTLGSATVRLTLHCTDEVVHFGPVEIADQHFDTEPPARPGNDAARVPSRLNRQSEGQMIFQRCEPRTGVRLDSNGSKLTTEHADGLVAFVSPGPALIQMISPTGDNLQVEASDAEPTGVPRDSNAGLLALPCRELKVPEGRAAELVRFSPTDKLGPAVLGLLPWAEWSASGQPEVQLFHRNLILELDELRSAFEGVRGVDLARDDAVRAVRDAFCEASLPFPFRRGQRQGLSNYLPGLQLQTQDGASDRVVKIELTEAQEMLQVEAIFAAPDPATAPISLGRLGLPTSRLDGKGTPWLNHGLADLSLQEAGQSPRATLVTSGPATVRSANGSWPVLTDGSDWDYDNLGVSRSLGSAHKGYFVERFQTHSVERLDDGTPSRLRTGRIVSGSDQLVRTVMGETEPHTDVVFWCQGLKVFDDASGRANDAATRLQPGLYGLCSTQSVWPRVAGKEILPLRLTEVGFTEMTLTLVKFVAVLPSPDLETADYPREAEQSLSSERCVTVTVNLNAVAGEEQVTVEGTFSWRLKAPKMVEFPSRGFQAYVCRLEGSVRLDSEGWKLQPQADLCRVAMFGRSWPLRQGFVPPALRLPELTGTATGDVGRPIQSTVQVGGTRLPARTGPLISGRVWTFDPKFRGEVLAECVHVFPELDPVGGWECLWVVQTGGLKAPKRITPQLDENNPQRTVFLCAAIITMVPDGKFLLAGQADNVLALWFVGDNGPSIWAKAQMGSRILSVDWAVTPSGNLDMLVGLTDGCRLCRFSGNQFSTIQEWPLPSGATKVWVSPDGSMLALSKLPGGKFQRLRLLENGTTLMSDEFTGTVFSRPGPLQPFVIHQGKLTVASASQLEDSADVLSLSFDPFGEYVALHGALTTRLWRLTDGEGTTRAELVAVFSVGHKADRWFTLAPGPGAPWLMSLESGELEVWAAEGSFAGRVENAAMSALAEWPVELDTEIKGPDQTTYQLRAWTTLSGQSRLFLESTQAGQLLREPLLPKLVQGPYYSFELDGQPRVGLQQTGLLLLWTERETPRFRLGAVYVRETREAAARVAVVLQSGEAPLSLEGPRYRLQLSWSQAAPDGSTEWNKVSVFTWRAEATKDQSSWELQFHEQQEKGPARALLIYRERSAAGDQKAVQASVWLDWDDTEQKYLYRPALYTLSRVNPDPGQVDWPQLTDLAFPHSGGSDGMTRYDLMPVQLEARNTQWVRLIFSNGTPEYQLVKGIPLDPESDFSRWRGPDILPAAYPQLIHRQIFGARMRWTTAEPFKGGEVGGAFHPLEGEVVLSPVLDLGPETGLAVAEVGLWCRPTPRPAQSPGEELPQSLVTEALWAFFRTSIGQPEELPVVAVASRVSFRPRDSSLAWLEDDWRERLQRGGQTGVAVHRKLVDGAMPVYTFVRSPWYDELEPLQEQPEGLDGLDLANPLADDRYVANRLLREMPPGQLVASGGFRHDRVRRAFSPWSAEGLKEGEVARRSVCLARGEEPLWNDPTQKSSVFSSERVAYSQLGPVWAWPKTPATEGDVLTFIPKQLEVRYSIDKPGAMLHHQLTLNTRGGNARWAPLLEFAIRDPLHMATPAGAAIQIEEISCHDDQFLVKWKETLGSIALDSLSEATPVSGKQGILQPDEVKDAFELDPNWAMLIVQVGDLFFPLRLQDPALPLDLEALAKAADIPASSQPVGFYLVSRRSLLSPDGALPVTLKVQTPGQPDARQVIFQPIVGKIDLGDGELRPLNSCLRQVMEEGGFHLYTLNPELAPTLASATGLQFVWVVPDKDASNQPLVPELAEPVIIPWRDRPWVTREFRQYTTPKIAAFMRSGPAGGNLIENYSQGKVVEQTLLFGESAGPGGGRPEILGDQIHYFKTDQDQLEIELPTLRPIKAWIAKYMTTGQVLLTDGKIIQGL